MLAIPKNSCIFEVLDNLQGNAKNTETKTKGRRTGESTAVNSKHCFGVSSSDLPLFINQNHFTMLDTNDELATTARRNHTRNRATLTETILRLTFPELIKRFFEEMDAKNRAYFFILEKGHHDEFVNYCNERRAS